MVFAAIWMQIDRQGYHKVGTLEPYIMQYNLNILHSQVVGTQKLLRAVLAPSIGPSHLAEFPRPNFVTDVSKVYYAKELGLCTMPCEENDKLTMNRCRSQKYSVTVMSVFWIQKIDRTRKNRTGY